MKLPRWSVVVCLALAVAASGCARQAVLTLTQENTRRTLRTEAVLVPAAPARGTARDSSGGPGQEAQGEAQMETTTEVRVVDRFVVP